MERANILVPTEGVRADINDLVHTPSQMRRGKNILVYDGTVRPRPGLNREDIGNLINNWKLLASGHSCFSAFEEGFLIFQDSAGDWFYSDDHGLTWSAATVNGPGTVVKLLALHGTSTILAWEADSLWIADTSTFVDTLTFTELGDYRNPAQPASVHFADPVFYDDVHDVVWWQCWGRWGRSAKLNCLVDASIATDVTSLSFGPTAANPVKMKLIGCSRAGSFPYANVVDPRSTSPKFLYMQWSGTVASPGDPLNETPALTYTSDRWFYRLWSFDFVPNPFATGLTSNTLASFYLSSDHINEDDLTFLADRDHDAHFRMWCYEGTSDCMVGIKNKRSDDTRTTWLEFEDFPSDSTRIYNMLSYGDGSNYFFLESTNQAGLNEAWFINGQIADGVEGDTALGTALSLFQGDLSTEPSAIFCGTTARLLHFNLASDAWEDLTPYNWVTVTPDEIDGDADTNHWVFRVMEKGSSKYVLATNGQLPPCAWKETLAEFRPIGDEDEDLEIGVGEAQAPIADAMAIANNRLVLGRGSSVYLSDPQDFDNGYDVEYRLTDTSGDIVAMRELNAITIAILKEDAIYHGISQAEFMGVSAPMRFELVKAGVVGPCSDASVVYLPDGRLCWLGRDGGVYIYDGAVPVDAGRNIRHAIYNSIDQDRLEWAHATVDTQRNLLWIFFPTIAGGMSSGIVLSIDQGQSWPFWTFRYPESWDMMASLHAVIDIDLVYGDFDEDIGPSYGDLAEVAYGDFESQRWKFLLMRGNTSIYLQDWSAAHDATVPIDVEMHTGWYDFDDLYTYDTFHEMHHLIMWAVTLNPPPGENLLYWTLVSEQGRPASTRRQSSPLYNTGRAKTSYRQTGRRHRFEMSGEVTEVFHWGGATGLYSRRGNR